MADGQEEERDDEWFKEVYGREYTGPPRPSRDNHRDGSGKGKKRSGGNTSASAGESDEDDEPPDPNAVPTDFTSREAKVWEAKAKAVERNWKRRKEEELTCRICGQVGHFAQGCPTTLGGNPRKPGEVVERISLRDKRLKPRLIGTGGSVIQNIEKDTGCRLKLEDNLTVGNGAFFVKIMGPDKLSVSKAADTVRTLVDQVEDEWKQQNSRRSQGSFRASNVNPLIAAQMQHIAVQRLQHSPNVPSLPGRGEGAPPLDEDKRTIEHIASQLEARRHWEAVAGSSQGLNGSGTSPSFSYKEVAGGKPSQGRGASGAGSIQSQFAGKGSGAAGIDGATYYHGSNHDSGYQGGSTNLEQEQDMDLGYEEQPLPQTIEDLEQRFLQETVEITKDQNAEEDKENARHRELMREIQEQYQQKMTTLRSKHAKQREEYLRREAQMRQQQYQSSGYFQYASGGSANSGRTDFNGNSYELRGHLTGTDGHSSYDSYKDGLSQMNTHSYSRKHGYESSKGYSGNQGYDSSPYYGSSQAYQTYG